MVPFKKKWLIYVILSAVLLFAYRRTVLYAFAPGANYSKPPKGFKFEWKYFKENHPVKSFVPLPSGPVKTLPKVQHAFSDQSFKEILSKQKSRQEAVKQTFLRAWNAYRNYAWMHDEVTPLTRGSYNTFGGWAATLVDSLDTLWIMDLKDEFQEAVGAVADIDFTMTKSVEINVFETTIRYLGGLLSAYDLSGEPGLLTKATELGNILYVAFDTPNRMPVTRWKIHAAFLHHKQEASAHCLLAEIGSLTMEFTRLSQLTKDPKWYDAVHRVTKLFEEQQGETMLPGMWPLILDARKRNLQGQRNSFTLGAMADSFYEYLPKMHALLGGVDDMYGRMYKDAMAVVAKHVLYRPMVPDNADILFSGMVTAYANRNVQLSAEGQHLVCFAGGMFALGSKLFDIPAHMDIARKLTDGCIWAYKATPSGMMPEVFHMVPCAANEPCFWDEAKYKKAVADAHENSRPSPNQGQGQDQDNSAEAIIARERLPKGIKSITDRRYILRPEAIESVFILYRTTGRTELLDTAWEMFTAIEDMTKSPYGNAGLDDVTTATGATGEVPLSNRMESFWLAETLKYFYLMFSDPSLVSLDEYVFNTEAHPFRRMA
ncbi:glycosyl hydrolase [Histoplasma capsulatum G186AR]|uniref:alpha-1,2-Mannosidase n=2 Tax=Ajellomyces capsulatus TaxID=5037 RepID=C0NQ44_AJECG|nr:glycosyl hydrolase [Histoplasma capsulatum G186AR]EEH07054.1 glycosyl hydrolase [Histoplasma capsulatum G186AR]KAG5293919.1 glycosyl hydrolase [Histoplasma capsulatum]QSS75371.1 glycosyl hydrolase [Histoplasma capsulatum G186AR]